MFCKNCGHELPEDAKFCMKCGTLLKSESSSAETDGKPIASNAEDSQTVHTSAVANRERLLWMMVVILVVVVGILAIALGTTKMGKQNNVEPNDEAIAEVQDSHETTTTDLTTTAATTTITTTKATTKATTAAITTTKQTTATTAEKVQTYSVTFEADELIAQAGLDMSGAHVAIALLSNLTCTNGTATAETSTMYIYDCLVRVTVTGATAGEVKISGTITTYGLDTLDGQTVSYPVSAGTFVVSKTVGGNSGNASNASQNANSSNNASHASSSVSGMKGQINCHGGTVAGFTTDYVVNSGACGIVRQSLGNTWHVTAKNSCYNYGITWYELWDSDDGDYYGWVDANYIDFY